MLSAEVHIGTMNSDMSMVEYIWKRRPDGVHLLNLGKTWEKLMLAARIIVTIENPEDVVCISARTYGQRAVLKYSQYTGAQCIAGRFTPGTFTNQMVKGFKEPRLLIVTDPRVDTQAVKEASYANIPVIAFSDSDTSLKFVDCAIPGNNKGKLSIGLLYWLLAREVQRLRGSIERESPWEVPVDLFFYRDPEELEKSEEMGYAEEAAAISSYKESTVTTAGEVFKTETFEAPAAGFDAATAPAPVDGGWDAAAAPPAAGWDASQASWN